MPYNITLGAPQRDYDKIFKALYVEEQPKRRTLIDKLDNYHFVYIPWVYHKILYREIDDGFFYSGLLTYISHKKVNVNYTEKYFNLKACLITGGVGYVCLGKSAPRIVFTSVSELVRSVLGVYWTSSFDANWDKWESMNAQEVERYVNASVTILGSNF